MTSASSNNINLRDFMQFLDDHKHELADNSYLQISNLLMRENRVEGLNQRVNEMVVNEIFVNERVVLNAKQERLLDCYKKFHSGVKPSFHSLSVFTLIYKDDESISDLEIRQVIPYAMEYWREKVAGNPDWIMKRNA